MCLEGLEGSSGLEGLHDLGVQEGVEDATQGNASSAKTRQNNASVDHLSLAPDQKRETLNSCMFCVSIFVSKGVCVGSGLKA